MRVVLILLFGVAALYGLGKAIAWANDSDAAEEDGSDELDKWTNPDRLAERGESHPPGLAPRLHYWEDDATSNSWNGQDDHHNHSTTWSHSNDD